MTVIRAFAAVVAASASASANGADGATAHTSNVAKSSSDVSIQQLLTVAQIHLPVKSIQ